MGLCAYSDTVGDRMCISFVLLGWVGVSNHKLQIEMSINRGLYFAMSLELRSDRPCVIL